VASQSDVVSQMIAVLAASEPDLDTTTGSVTRKILDAVAASIASATLDSQMLTYQYDIDSMTGAALDSFVQLFGMTRYPAARSTGTVTFTRPTATDVVTAAVGCQIASADGTVVTQTLTAAVMDATALTVSVPVQAVVAGPGGNVAAGTLTQLLTPVSEVTAVTNTSALSGGSNQETDSQLQARWKATVFKNMAGTSQMFLGIALNDPDCQAANVVDGQTRRREQLQISGGSATCTVTDDQYTYPSGQVVGRNIDGGDIAAPGIQYTWNYQASPPSIQAIDRSYFPEGQLIDVSYLFIDTASRNNPQQGVYNRIDVWCAGSRAQAASASVKFATTTTFQSSSTSNWYTKLFVRPDGTAPATGNVFVALPYGPIITVPPTMVINGTTYGLASPANPLGTVSGGVTYAYQIVHRAGAYGWSPYSDFGLEWNAANVPAAGSVLVLSEDYTFNDVPYAIQQQLENWRLAGTDVQAHQGVEVELQFSLAIIYDPSTSQAVTQAAINTALSSYLAQLGFDSRLYPSSILQIVEGVPGVTACRFLTAADYPTWGISVPNNYNVGIQAVSGGLVVQSYVDSQGNPVDIEFGANQIPGFGNTVLVTKAGNTMGSYA
jgi:uncharacterized phage protein gp47/JayE